jgi:hypothetical protein
MDTQPPANIIRSQPVQCSKASLEIVKHCLLKCGVYLGWPILYIYIFFFRYFRFRFFSSKLNGNRSRSASILLHNEIKRRLLLTNILHISQLFDLFVWCTLFNFTGFWCPFTVPLLNIRFPFLLNLNNIICSTITGISLIKRILLYIVR